MKGKKSKNLVVYFRSSTPILEPYQGLRATTQGRQEDLLACFSDEVNIFMCRYEKNYHGDNYFSPEFQKINNQWIKIESKKIYAHRVLGFGFGDTLISNIYPNPISEITCNKSIAPQLFPEYFLPYILCNNYEEIQQNFHTISSLYKVMKPLTGSGGKAIYIDTQLPDKNCFQTEDFPYILQEFFDTSEGFYQYPGIHDFRVVILNGEIIGKILRQPQAGKQISNTTSGGSLKDIGDFDIPDEIHKIIQEIDTYCNKYPHRYYSIDFGRSKNGEIKIFELNSAPALSTPHIARSLGKYIAHHLI